MEVSQLNALKIKAGALPSDGVTEYLTEERDNQKNTAEILLKFALRTVRNRVFSSSRW